MIANEIRKALKAATRPDKDIADEAGIHRVNLSHFKHGTRETLPIEQLESLANALGLEITLKKLKKKK